MKSSSAATLFSFLVILTACASPRGPQQEGRPDQTLQQPERLLATARKIQTEKGCAKAIPTYRVISSFGDGHAVAQYELGACLLKIESVNVMEASLFREESILWLRRAAWAGNARAQLKLAQLLSGVDAHDGVLDTKEEAMGWAILYDDNPARNLFDLPPISPLVISHLRATLTPDSMNRAAAFAKDFEKIKMASFIPPPPEHAVGKPSQRPHGRSGGQRRRRR